MRAVKDHVMETGRWDLPSNFTTQASLAQSELMLLSITTTQTAGPPVIALGCATPAKCVYLCVSSPHTLC